MQKISILGCGWLGRPLGKTLVESGHIVMGSTTTEAKLDTIAKAGMSPVLLDLDGPFQSNWNYFLSSEIVIICIPPRSTSGEPLQFVRQMSNLVDALNTANQKILFISSTAVYHPSEKSLKEGDASLSSKTRSGVSLLEVEQLYTKSKSFVTTIIRFGGLFGNERAPGRFLAGKKQLAGGNNPINMIHLDDCIGTIAYLIRNEMWGETFNICAPINQTRKEFYSSAAKAIAVAPPDFSDEQAPFKKVNCDKWKVSSDYQFKIVEAPF